MPAPRETLALLNNMNGPDLQIHPERCVLVRNRNASCLKCAEACTSGALSANADGLVVNPDLCIGCGTCATVCPTCALEPANPDDQALAKAAAHVSKQTGECVPFACSRALSAAGKNRVPGCVEVACLGRIDVTELVELYVRGTRNVVLACDDCETCPHASGGSVAEHTVGQTLDLLDAFGAGMSIVTTHQVEPLIGKDAVDGADEVASYPLKRLARLEATPRETLDAASDTVAEREGFEDGRYYAPATDADEADDDTAASAEDTNAAENPSASEAGGTENDLPKLPRVGSSGTLSQFVPTRRTRLFNCLKALGDPGRQTVSSGLWGTVSIRTDLCDSCRMCAVFCPTGALRRFDGNDGAFGITHQSVFCVQCDTCESVCPHGAITVSPDVDLKAFLSGHREFIELERPTWEPNKSDSIFKKMVTVLGANNNLATY